MYSNIPTISLDEFFTKYGDIVIELHHINDNNVCIFITRIEEEEAVLSIWVQKTDALLQSLDSNKAIKVRHINSDSFILAQLKTLFGKGFKCFGV